jgi:hypothetical protein
MHRIYRLPVREQLMVFKALREYLGSEVGEETIFDKEIRERLGALEAMRRVAEHWGLEANVAPTATQHKRTPAEVTEGWSSTRVGEAWGRYRYAQQAFRGEIVPEIAAQRSLHRATTGRKRSREEYVSGVRKWLKADPASRTRKDYDDYVRKHNSEVLSGKEKGPAMVSSLSVMTSLGMRWDAVLRFCADEGDYDALRAEAQQERQDENYGPLGLISTWTVGHMLGHEPSTIAYMHGRGNFPVPVLMLKKAHGWYIKDIEAFAAGRTVPVRQENELRPQVMDTDEVAHLLGIAPQSLRSALHRKAKTAPPPDGRIGWCFIGCERRQSNGRLNEASPPFAHAKAFKLRPDKKPAKAKKITG